MTAAAAEPEADQLFALSTASIRADLVTPSPCPAVTSKDTVRVWPGGTAGSFTEAGPAVHPLGNRSARVAAGTARFCVAATVTSTGTVAPKPISAGAATETSTSL